MPIKLKIGKKNKPEKKKELNLKEILNKRIYLPKTVKLTAIGIIAIFILFSAVSAYNLSQKPTEETKSNIVLTHSQTGNYNYKVYLKNNTVYDGKEYLTPGEGEIFRKLVDSINASFSYNFQISQPADISGSYTISAMIQTAYWTKTYTLVNTTTINVDNRNRYSFSESFRIEYSFYEQVIDDITNETGVSVQNPNLIIKCNIQLTADTGEETIPQTLNPSLNVSLREETIDISDSLILRSSGSRTEQETIKHPEISEEKNKWTNIAMILIILSIIVFAVTKTEKKPLSKIKKKLNRIKKKYGEWMIEIKKQPSKIGADVIPVESMDDLVKLSEEMGKPIIFYNNSTETIEKYNFYVLEEKNHYLYTLS